MGAMKRVLSYCHRSIPPFVQASCIRTEPSWRGFETSSKRETYSTTQQDRLWDNDPVEPAILSNTANPKQPARGRDGPDPTKQPAKQLRGGRQENKAPTNVVGSGTRSAQKVAQWVRHTEARHRKSRADRSQKSSLVVERAPRTRHAGKRLDEAFLRSNYAIPSIADYPNLPAGFFEDPIRALLYSSSVASSKLKVSCEVKQGVFQTTAVCGLRDGRAITAVGEGLQDSDAVKAARLHLIAKLHESGILKGLFSQKFIDSEHDRQLIRDEVDAKADIYNYAARFDAVPQFSIQENFMRWRARKRKVVDVTVELSEQNIKVTGRGDNLKSAEIGAAIRFKQEAEKYHAGHGDSAITIKDSTALNSLNAMKFFDFYKMIHRDTNFSVTSEMQLDRGKFGSTPYRSQVSQDDEPLGEPVEMTTKKKAEELAYLTAAVALRRKEQDLYPQFVQALKDGNGDILRPINPIAMPIDSDCILIMRETLHGVRRAGLADAKDEVISDEESEQTRQARVRRRLPSSRVQARNEDLKNRHQAYLQNNKLEHLRQLRADLPMNHYRSQVKELVQNNNYSIIVGATGSGKTTQVPQILLEDAISESAGAHCNVICTQPRRIAATSVARRVAEERDEPLQRSVGYHVRFDAKVPEVGGSITYCTTGILLQQLQHSPDDILDDVSHLIIDEVHERDMLIDFLLIILKKAMEERLHAGKSTPKVVLMSATMDTELFATYFKQILPGGIIIDCPSLNVPGRLFPVKENYLDSILDNLEKSYSKQDLTVLRLDPATKDYLAVEKDYSETSSVTNRALPASEDTNGNVEAVIDWKREGVQYTEDGVQLSNEKEDSLVPFGLVAMTVAHIARISDVGAILVFLPGLNEILKVEDMLRREFPLGVRFTDESKFKISILHSSIPAGQNDVFNNVAKGCRKIILSTNIAETSVTIPDVQYVVDTGKLREKRYDQVRRITKLQCTWVSKSNSRQRAGRAGRVQNGNYYALFSKARYDSLRAIGLPEILRSDLQETCLAIKAQAFKTPIRDFLSEAIEPPSPTAVDTSVVNLQKLEALTEDEKLTSLGRLLASLPVHPSLGKMIILGVIFRCLDPMLILGAATSERSIFITPLERRRESNEIRLSFVEGTGSDHIALLNAFREWRHLRDRRGQHEAYSWAMRNFIHVNACKTVDQTAQQIQDILVEAGLIPYTAPKDRHMSEVSGRLLNENSSKIPLIKALALAGLHPNLAVNLGGRTFRTPGEKGTMIHPSSINYPRSKEDDDRYTYGSLLTYSVMAKGNDGNSIFLRDTSETTPLMATLFGGKLTSQDNVMTMDRWLPFYVKTEWKGVKTIVEFRKALDRLLTEAFSDLTAGRSKNRGYLADDPTRELFAQGLVDVLDRDVRVKESVASRGWRK
ncbi:MAG: hypothetical protein M1827_005799 [Pycnora praestabilis]|nr:MAG: hypothetical protein M1827_005799 [Pycnora praestabilis]